MSRFDDGSPFAQTAGRPYRMVVPSTGLVIYNGVAQPGSYTPRFSSRCAMAVYVPEPPAIEFFPDPAAPLAVEGEPGGESEAMHGAGLPATTT